MDKKLYITSEYIEFRLNTVFSLDAINKWIIDGLNKTYGYDNSSTAMFINLHNSCNIRSGERTYYLINNYMFEIELFEDKWGYCLSISKNTNVTDEEMIKLIVNIFKVIHQETHSFERPTILGSEKFFYTDVCFSSSNAINDFDAFAVFSVNNPFSVEYPTSEQTKAEYHVDLMSDFIDKLTFEYTFEVHRNKEENEIYSDINFEFYGAVLDKTFPEEEQLYLVEDVTKELLSRAATFKTELEMKINDK